MLDDMSASRLYGESLRWSVALTRFTSLGFLHGVHAVSVHVHPSENSEPDHVPRPGPRSLSETKKMRGGQVPLQQPLQGPGMVTHSRTQAQTVPPGYPSFAPSYSQPPTYAPAGYQGARGAPPSYITPAVNMIQTQPYARSYTSANAFTTIVHENQSRSLPPVAPPPHPEWRVNAMPQTGTLPSIPVDTAWPVGPPNLAVNPSGASLATGTSAAELPDDKDDKADEEEELYHRLV